jgi:hypothetical protein
MTTHGLLLILLILVILGFLPIGPWWGPSGGSYGWYPSAGGIILLILLLFVFGVL